MISKLYVKSNLISKGRVSFILIEHIESRIDNKFRGFSPVSFNHIFFLEHLQGVMDTFKESWTFKVGIMYIYTL